MADPPVFHVQPFEHRGVEVKEALLGRGEVGADPCLLDFKVGTSIAPPRHRAACADHLGRQLLAQAVGPGCRQLDGGIELLDLGEIVGWNVALPAGAGRAQEARLPDLAVAAATVKEIADAMYLSPRTVEPPHPHLP
ncbi:MAG: hypothetical protein ACYDH5_03635 [Acidimicrobiales bacterium]